MSQDAESARLQEADTLASTRSQLKAVAGKKPWRKWGPYLSERQWGTVREDYSQDGNAWDYFTHDQARSRAYHWGEDGLAGISDNQQFLCFGLAPLFGRRRSFLGADFGRGLGCRLRGVQFCDLVAHGLAQALGLIGGRLRVGGGFREGRRRRGLSRGGRFRRGWWGLGRCRGFGRDRGGRFGRRRWGLRLGGSRRR